VDLVSFGERSKGSSQRQPGPEDVESYAEGPSFHVVSERTICSEFWKFKEKTEPNEVVFELIVPIGYM
jgi:hypothetical protein